MWPDTVAVDRRGTCSEPKHAGSEVTLATAALAVVIAAATNNVMKGVYALVFGAPRVGRLSLAILSAVGLASLVVYLAL